MATTLRSFVNDLDQIVKQQSVNNALKLAKGSTPDMESYNRQVGINQGMMAVVSIAREMLGRMESDIDGSSLPEMPEVGDES